MRTRIQPDVAGLPSDVTGVHPPPGESVAFHDGHVVPVEDARLAVGSVALRYAVSVFEGVRVYRTNSGALRPWLLTEHVERLRQSMLLMRLPDPGVDRLPDLVSAVTEHNRMTDDAYCRVAVSAADAGVLDSAVRPALTVSVTAMGRKKWLAESTGMRLAISAWRKPPESAFPSAVKSISNYAGPRIALLEAKADGFDGCLLLSAEGAVSEAPTAALFVVRDNTLRTPRLADGVLPSITRAWVLAAARSEGMDAAACRLTADDVRGADEVFLCGTGIEFASVESVDGVRCGAWPARETTSRLVRRYFDEVRADAPRSRTLTWNRDD